MGGRHVFISVDGDEPKSLAKVCNDYRVNYDRVRRRTNLGFTASGALRIELLKSGLGLHTVIEISEDMMKIMEEEKRLEDQRRTEAERTSSRYFFDVSYYFPATSHSGYWKVKKGITEKEYNRLIDAKVHLRVEKKYANIRYSRE